MRHGRPNVQPKVGQGESDRTSRNSSASVDPCASIRFTAATRNKLTWREMSCACNSLAPSALGDVALLQRALPNRSPLFDQPCAVDGRRAAHSPPSSLPLVAAWIAWVGLGFGFGLGLGLELGIGLGLGLVLGIGLGLGLAPGRCSCVATQLGTAIRGWRCSRRALRLGMGKD